MKRELRDEWVERLLSGEYEQCESVLRSAEQSNAFCCLGVLADIYAPDDWNTRVEDLLDRTAGWYEHQGCDALLSADMCESLGITSDQQNYYAEQNDAGKTFPEIAEMIGADDDLLDEYPPSEPLSDCITRPQIP